ncbi:MAG: IPT/TIG domain-containing protein [Balneolaceae bacterium]
MKVKNNFLPVLFVVATLLFTSCKDGNSIYNPDYEPSRPAPEITNISPEVGYLAGVDSVIVTGTNFATDPDSLIIDFGGSAGIIKEATKTRLVVRPGTNFGDDLSVRVAVRGADFFSNSYPYDLAQPFGIYPGLTSTDSPSTPVAVDDQNNVYAIITSNGVIRYTKIAPDGTKEIDQVKYPGEPRPDVEDTRPYPSDSTMRFTAYSDIEVGPGGTLLLAQQNIRAIFQKTFGNGLREGVWTASGATALKIRDMIYDNNGYLWVVGFDSDEIHRFTVADRSETRFPFEGDFSSVAFKSDGNELYVGGLIDGKQSVWKFTIDASGNIGTGELYFDFSEYYNGTVSSMIFASNGELLITTGTQASDITKPSIVRVFPNGTHQELYEGMIKPGAYSITWRDDNFAVVAIQGDETSINFLDMYDRSRSGVFGF